MIPWHPLIKIIKAQGDILMVYKPCGVLSHPNTSDICKQSLMLAPYDISSQAYKTAEGPIYLLNRLDSPTSGLVVLCTQATTAKQIRQLFKNHKVKKIYQAIVKGRFAHQDTIWQDRLQIEKNHPYLRTYRTSSADGILAKTTVKGLQTFDCHGEPFSLIQLTPITGRTHQLRVQCAQHHFPILGDKTYGDFKCNRRLKTERLYLHACSITFTIGTQKIEGHCKSNFLENIQQILRI